MNSTLKDFVRWYGKTPSKKESQFLNAMTVKDMENLLAYIPLDKNINLVVDQEISQDIIRDCFLSWIEFEFCYVDTNLAGRFLLEMAKQWDSQSFINILGCCESMCDHLRKLNHVIAKAK